MRYHFGKRDATRGVVDYAPSFLVDELTKWHAKKVQSPRKIPARQS